ncbi:MAG: M20 family metallopeptidase [Anaerolineae bacterium]|nr:amidohydrolase [Anaerolineales bacterium]MCQ3978234.1 amidohydrolase [Anaerolineae bacterium]
MLNQAKALSQELIRLRRDFHHHPELGFQEVRTARVVAETLQEIGGMTIRTGVGKTGVVADLGTGSGPTIAIRADMDALPILEKTEAEYASINPGVMHACGHDAHTAILLGVAHLLKDTFAQNNLQGNVRFLFQPAEEVADSEGISGAPRMIEDGALEGVDAIIALHMDSTSPCSTVSIQCGWSSAAADTFDAWLTGTGGHGAFPHLNTDPLWMLAPVLMALHGIVARRVDPLKAAVVSLGQVHAGKASNVIPGEVYLQGTLRSFDPEVREQLIVEVERALELTRSLGGDYRLKIERGYPAGWNDPTVTNWLSSVSADLLGAEQVKPECMSMGAEDFAFMGQKAPGAMIMVGAAKADGLVRNHHTDIFDIDEQALPIGAAILAETARRFLAGELSLGQ